jgi:hypothetical protein
MNPIELPALIMTLAGSTALGRLSHSEQHAVFDKLADLGYVVAKAAPTTPVA